MIVKHGIVDVADLKTKDRQWEFPGYDVHNVAYGWPVWFRCYWKYSNIQLVVNKYKSDDVSGDAVRHDIVMFIASNKQLRGDLEERLQAQGISIGDYIVNMSKGTT